jgi:gamma-glutamyltranspeptidase/glutathione hydrolase
MQTRMTLLKSLCVSLFSLALVAGCAAPPGPPAPAANQAKEAAADPRAVAAGVEILEQGGTAIDAAIATMMVLGLVEPQSAGIGGGGFLMHFDAATKAVDAFDGRETAPAAITPSVFLDKDNKPLAFRDAVESGLSTGAPSLVAMLKMAHEAHGGLPWARLFGPAIRLADEGFAISPRLRTMIQFGDRNGVLSADPTTKAYFFAADGQPLPVGFIRTNPAYAATLRAIAKDGPQALSQGPIAEAIIATTQRPPRAGQLSLADLQAYRPRRLAPVCGAFRAYRVCGMGPPSSGGVAVLSILGLYERARPVPIGPDNADDWAAFLWASRIAYVDRDHYVGDDQFVPVPVKGLTDPRYLDVRAREMDLSKAAPIGLQPGDPSRVTGEPSLLEMWGRDRTAETPGTTHLSVTDAKGNAVALTATVESIFGNKRMTAGFFLNNQLTDFSLEPTKNARPVANAPQAGKRPRSSMSPTLVLRPDGSLEAVVGSPGGSAIIAYVAKTIIAMLDWGHSPQAAIDLPNLVASRPQVRIEPNRMPESLGPALTARGWTLQDVTIEGSGLHVIRMTPAGAIGGADPRREGAAQRPAAPTMGR